MDFTAKLQKSKNKNLSLETKFVSRLDAFKNKACRTLKRNQRSYMETKFVSYTFPTATTLITSGFESGKIINKNISPVTFPTATNLIQQGFQAERQSGLHKNCPQFSRNTKYSGEIA